MTLIEEARQAVQLCEAMPSHASACNEPAHRFAKALLAADAVIKAANDYTIGSSRRRIQATNAYYLATLKE